MATVNRGNDTTETKTDNILVDPFGSIEEGDVRKLNNDANPDDAWSSYAPPPKGFYNLRLMPLTKDSCYKKLVDKDDANKGFYYSANCEFQIVSDNKEVDGNSVYGFVSTQLFRGRELSTMAALIKKCGFEPLPKGKSEISDGGLLQRFGKVSQKQPIIKDVFINWEAQYQDPDTKKYVKVLKDYDDFPVDLKGEKMHECTVTLPNRKEIDVRARAVIQWNVKKGEAQVITNNQAKKETPKPSVSDLLEGETTQAPPSKKTVNVSVDNIDDL